MKQRLSILVGWRHLILVLAGLLYGLLEPAYCQYVASPPPADSTVLLLQQTNPDGGMVTPAIGVHYFSMNSEVVVTAVPKSGYRFLYWIGDVSDPTANNTVVYLNTPKIVIAVFERSEFEFLEEVLQYTLGGRGGLRPSAGDYSNQGDVEGVIKPQEWEWDWPPWNPPKPPKRPEVPDDFPIPGVDEPNDFPVPEVPEPATVLLLGLGSLFLVKYRTKI
ncbi:MAG: PEP-CTERM sorting domain-containing protein [Sedimentisphaerales bacterium]|nr:PEP-CTERM sorting domain-containing protein [Sedimentisphaerales bacterium]